MPVVPTYEEKGKLDTAAQLIPRTDINESPVRALEASANATARVGAQVSSALNTFGEYYAGQEKAKADASTAIEFENLRQQQSAADLDAADKISADGTGYAEGRLKDFNARFQPFLDKLPEEQRQKYALDVVRLRGGISMGAAKAERDQRLDYAGKSIDSNLQGGLAAVVSNPDSLDSTIESHTSFIQQMNIPAEKKLELIRKNRDALQGAAFGKKLDQNDPTDGVQANANRASVMVNSRASDAVWSSLVKQESGGNPNAVSSAGALGVAQVMPGTARGIARQLGDDDVAQMSDGQLKAFFRANPDRNIAYGKFYLNQQLSAFNGDMEAALVAYNGGPGRARKWLASGRDDAVLPKETRQYYKAILGRVNLMGSTALATYSSSGPVRVAGGSSQSGLQTQDGAQGPTIRNAGDAPSDVSDDALTAAGAAGETASQIIYGQPGDIKKTGNPEADKSSAAEIATQGLPPKVVDALKGQGPNGVPTQSRQPVPDGTTADTGGRHHIFQGEGRYSQAELDAADAEVKPMFQRSLAAGYLPSQLDIAGNPLAGQKPGASGHEDDGDLAATVTVQTKDGKWINVESIAGGKALSKAEVKAAAAAGKGRVYDSRDAAVKAGGTVEDLEDGTDAQSPATASAAAVPTGKGAPAPAPEDPEVTAATTRANGKYQRRWSTYNDPDALGLPPRPETFDPDRESYKVFEAKQKAWDAEFKRRSAAVRKQDSDAIAEERAAGQEARDARREQREARADRRAEQSDQDEAHRKEIARLERLAWQNDPTAVDQILKANGDGTIRNRQEWDRIVGQNEGVLGEMLKRGIAVNAKAKAATQAQKREQATVKDLQKDDIASIRATGQGVQELGDDRIRKALGDDVADDHARERANALRFHQATTGMETMTRGDIEGRVASLAPRPGIGFMDAKRTYDDARKAADDLLKLRDRDAALSVEKDPAVMKAQDDLRSKRVTPQVGIAAVAEARIQAQRTAGIAEEHIAPITRDEALNILAPYDNAPPGRQKEAMTGMLKAVDATFGKNADRVFGVLMDVENADDDLRRQAGKIMRSIAQGRGVTPQQAQVMDNGAAANSEKRALGRLDAAPAPAAAPVDRRTSIPQGARLMLRDNPNLWQQFDAKYGAGSAKGVLGVYGVKIPEQPRP